MAVRPPNILIYCCKNSSAFESVSRMLVANVGPARYTVYQLDESETWQHHCSLVVIASHPREVSHRALAQIKQFSRDGGKILSMGGYFSSLLPLESFEEPPGPCLDHLCYSPSHLPLGQGKQKSLLVIPIKSFCDKSILSKVLLELGIVGQNHCKTELQPLHVYSRSSTILDKFFESLKSQCLNINMDGELLFPMSSRQDDSDVPIIRRNCKDIEFFKDYEDIEFPEVFIHSEAVTSTQDLLWSNSIFTSSSESIAMLADVQVTGKGRGKNQWISPIGSMCFSFHFTLPQNVYLTSKLPFVQYITALATVRAIDEIYETNLSIKIKWPNDIYTSDGVKVGGVLVNCSNNGSINQLCVGIGLNVNNSEPTFSLAKLSGKTVPVARLASKLCRVFVEEIGLFNELGHTQFIERFCQKWLHQDKTVKISVGKINCNAVIKSIDSDGYLSVLNLTTNKVVSVQPDGNSFDMMENLIAVKSN